MRELVLDLLAGIAGGTLAAPGLGHNADLVVNLTAADSRLLRWWC